MIPAPITTILSGTAFSDNAPVDDNTVSSSIWRKKYHHFRKGEEFTACRQRSMQTRGAPSLWNSGQMSPEVQNRGISGPTKWLMSSEKFIKKRKETAIYKVYITVSLGIWKVTISIQELTSIPGKGVTSDPVAMRMFLVLTVSTDPSWFVTCTSFGFAILPWPSALRTWNVRKVSLLWLYVHLY